MGHFLPQNPQRNQPCWHSDFRLLVSRTVREYISVILSHTGCGNLSQQPLDTNAAPQSSLVAQLCPTLCDPMGCSMPGFPVHYQLLELAKTHVHWVSDAIQPSHSLSSPSPPAFTLSQHQWVSFPMSLFFASGGQSIGTSASASVLPMNIQNWFPLGLTGLISKQSKRLSRVFSNTTVQKHQFFRFFSAQLSL